MPCALTHTFAPGVHLFTCRASAAVARRRERFCRRQTANISANTQMGRQRVATRQKITANTRSSDPRGSSQRRNPLAGLQRRGKDRRRGRTQGRALGLNVGLSLTRPLKVKAGKQRPPSGSANLHQSLFLCLLGAPARSASAAVIVGETGALISQR